MSSPYNGVIVRINLSTGDIKKEKLDLNDAKKFIGGRGLGTKILMDEGIATVDPMSDKNKLVYITGPLTGAAVPTGGRYMVVTKSPLTGMIASSNSGGVWGAKLKYAGIDALIVEGVSSKPCYLYIDDSEIILNDASDLWGKETLDVEEVLKQRHEGVSVLNIGPAGENKGFLSCIMNDGDRAAGRSGVGAVMGSKNLKAIVVKSSKNSIAVNDAEKLKEAVKVCNAKIKENGVTGQGLPAYGTAVLVNIINNIGSLPVNNWQSSYFEDADKISGESMKDTILSKQGFCHRCPIGCGRVVKVEGREFGGPEYEPLWAYGANCGISDLVAIAKANEACNEMGLDAIGTPCTIATAMELYQQGKITDADCDGVPLKWGNTEAIIEWTKRMGKKEGKLASLMADGSYRLCEYYGVPELSMSVKKQEIPAYDARGIQGIGITYATSNRGGCHVRGYLISPEVLGLPEQLDRFSIENKAFWAKAFQDLTAVIDSVGMCLFTSFALGAPEYADLLSAATGEDYSVENLMLTGERIYNIERLFNKAAGMDAKDDKLPKRLMEEPIVDGPSKGETSKISVTLPEYYKVRGWENAFPTDETIEKLELTKYKV